MRSRLSRICWICALSGWHSGDWPVNSAKNPPPSQPRLFDCGPAAVEIGLLLGDGVFGVLDLVGAGGIAGAAVDARPAGLRGARRPGLRCGCAATGGGGICAGAGDWGRGSPWRNRRALGHSRQGQAQRNSEESEVAQGLPHLSPDPVPTAGAMKRCNGDQSVNEAGAVTPRPAGFPGGRGRRPEA